MTGIEMTRARQMIMPSESRKEVDSGQGADFLQMLKDKQQAVDETAGKKPEQAVDETGQENSGTPDEESGGKVTDAESTAAAQAMATLQAQISSQIVPVEVSAEPVTAEGEAQPVAPCEEAADDMIRNPDGETRQEPISAQTGTWQEQNLQNQETPAIAETVEETLPKRPNGENVLPMEKETVQNTTNAQETRENAAENLPVQEAPEPLPESGKAEPEQPETEPVLSKKTEDGTGKIQDGEPGTNNGIAQLQNQGPRETARAQMADKPQAPVRTTQAELPADIGKAIAARMPAENGTLTIELEPASLGKVTVQVVYESGRTSLSLMASDPKTLEILSRNAGEIAGILENKTGQETVIYTYEAEQEFADSEEKGGENRQDSRDQREDRRNDQPDSFLQQLRLGLV